LSFCSYRWTYNDAPFDPSGNDGRIAIQPGVGTLIFAQPIARDEAYYQCFAYNVVGVAVSDNTNLRLGSKFVFCSLFVKSRLQELDVQLTSADYIVMQNSTSDVAAHSRIVH